MHYESAIENFKNAVALDPKLSVAQLYLATAYAQSVVPGVDTPENNQNAEQAIAAFKKVIDDPKSDKQTRVASLKGIASIYFNQANGLAQSSSKNFDAAMAYINFMYREKADIECGDNGARSEDLKTADNWFQKTTETKKAKAEKQMQQSGIVLDSPQKK